MNKFKAVCPFLVAMSLGALIGHLYVKRVEESKDLYWLNTWSQMVLPLVEQLDDTEAA